MWYTKEEINTLELGFLMKNKIFTKVLKPGKYLYWNFTDKYQVIRHSVQQVVLYLDQYIKDQIIYHLENNGEENNDIEVVKVKDNEMALVFIDDRFSCFLKAGNHILLTSFYNVKVEMVNTDEPFFEHEKLDVILRNAQSSQFLTEFNVPDLHLGLWSKNKDSFQIVQAGHYAFWKTKALIKKYVIDTREKSVEITGQELMTKDKVTLRINAYLNYTLTDALKAFTSTLNYESLIYREAQLVLRALIGGETLDSLLERKVQLSDAFIQDLKAKAERLGLEVISFGIKDIILPGEMKTLLNKVTEAKKAAEASVITRREETAAVRSQLNSAQLMDKHPTLMRLKELETLETLISKNQLSIVVGEEGLTKQLRSLVT